MDRIPVINIEALVRDSEPERKLRIAQEISSALKEYGFFYVVGHGIDPRLEENLENQSRHFFAQPLEEKLKISMKNGGKAWRGFFPLGGELTSGKPDMKEGIYFGAELPLDHPLVQAELPLHGPNLFPESIPGFRETVLEWISEMERLGHKIMEGIALSLELPEDYFRDIFSPEPLPLFRIFNYPALDPEVIEKQGSWGVGEHTDYGVLTILKQDTLGGLEVKTTKGEWIQAPPVPGSFICNIGDMLDRVTGGLYRSNPHRVRSPTKSLDRISFPFFFDPNFEARVNPIEELKEKVSAADDKDSRWDQASVHSFEGTYGDYLLLKVSRVFPELKRKVL